MANEEQKNILSIEDIEANKDEEYAEIDAWGGIFLAGSLTADDFIEWQEANEGPAKRNAGLSIITKSMCGKSATCEACNGKPLTKHQGLHVRTGSPKHIEILKKKAVAQTEKVVKAIAKLNGLNVKGDSDAKKD